jgi:hypothetical protein
LDERHKATNSSAIVTESSLRSRASKAEEFDRSRSPEGQAGYYLAAKFLQKELDKVFVL